jgi:hypothetical protein
MADQQVPGVVGPPITPASIFTMSVTPQEILLTFGSHRAIFAPDGEPIGGLVKEWVTTYSLSATAAKMLAAALAECLAQYEKTFGAVPMDPKFELQSISAGNDTQA